MAFENMKARMQARQTANPTPEEPPAPPAAEAPARPRGRPMSRPAPVEEVVVVEEDTPAPAPVASKPAVKTAPAGNALMMFDAGKASTALMAYVARADSSSFQDSPFPVSILSAGNSGGMFDAMKGTPGEVVALMPAGRQPFQAVFLGYRQVVVLWPTGYDEAAEEKAKPIASATIAPDSDEDMALCQSAAVKYMFTKKEDKVKFDETGHPRPYMEILVYLPKLDHLCVIRTVSHQQSLSNTMRSLAKCLPDGQIKPTPVLIQPITVEQKSKSQTWKMHHLELSLAIDANAKTMMGAFAKFATEVQGDADLMSDFSTWATNTVTDDIRQRLATAKTL